MSFSCDVAVRVWAFVGVGGRSVTVPCFSHNSKFWVAKKDSFLRCCSAHSLPVHFPPCVC